MRVILYHLGLLHLSRRTIHIATNKDKRNDYFILHNLSNIKFTALKLNIIHEVKAKRDNVCLCKV